MGLKLLLSVFKEEVLSVKSAILVLLLAFFFITVSFLIINYNSYLSFIVNDYPLLTKFKIFGLIFVGSFYATSLVDVFFLIILSILFGINMTILINKFAFLKRRGNLRIMFGTGIVSIVSTGCASCGLSFASLIGISAALAILPFGGIELYIIAVIILLASIYYNLKTIIRVCNIK